MNLVHQNYYHIMSGSGLGSKLELLSEMLTSANPAILKGAYFEDLLALCMVSKSVYLDTRHIPRDEFNFGLARWELELYENLKESPEINEKYIALESLDISGVYSVAARVFYQLCESICKGICPVKLNQGMFLDEEFFRLYLAKSRTKTLIRARSSKEWSDPAEMTAKIYLCLRRVYFWSIFEEKIKVNDISERFSLDDVTCKCMNHTAMCMRPAVGFQILEYGIPGNLDKMNELFVNYDLWDLFSEKLVSTLSPGRVDYETQAEDPYYEWLCDWAEYLLAHPGEVLDFFMHADDTYGSFTDACRHAIIISRINRDKTPLNVPAGNLYDGLRKAVSKYII